jgi:chaperone modulatory protein CbpM
VITIETVCIRVSGLDRADLDRWIENAWVRPERDGERVLFRDIDVARVRLIRELRDELHVEEETLPVVLSLLDQLYQTRRTMRRLRDAVVQAAPDDVVRRIEAVLLEQWPPG